MAFILPTFNINVRVWRAGGLGGTYAAPDLTTPANLSPGRRVMVANTGLTVVGGFALLMELLLPKLTDVRAPWNGVLGDIVEAPLGTKRFYQVTWVDDIGKGFSNEHRIAFLLFLVLGENALGGGPFPVPTPLP